MTTTALFAMLVLLQVKHYFFDFHWQPAQMLTGKGVYGNAWGLLHSYLHALGTLAAAVFVTQSLTIAALLAATDFVIHYHIDYIKVRFGIKDISRPLFWKQFGWDQLAHQLTYLLIAGLAVSLV